MEDYIGMIHFFGGNFAIRQYAKCEGQLLSISSNTALFSILGTTFGGDGRTTFALPDLRGRAPIGEGHGPGLSDIRLGQKGGAQTHTLNVAEMPSHTHAATVSVKPKASSTTEGDDDTATNAYLGQNEIYTSNAAGLVDMGPADATVSIGNSGGNQSFSVQSPYLGLTALICLYGLFPPRS
jgi:microcystin-dependent protein